MHSNDVIFGTAKNKQTLHELMMELPKAIAINPEVGERFLRS